LVSVRCVLLEVQRCAVVLLLVWKGDRRAGFIAGGARLLGGKALSLRVILPHDTWGGGLVTNTPRGTFLGCLCRGLRLRMLACGVAADLPCQVAGG